MKYMIWVIPVLLLISGTASAQLATNFKSDLLACKGIENDDARLACVDEILAQIDQNTAALDTAPSSKGQLLTDVRSNEVDRKPSDAFGEEDLLASDRSKRDKSPKVLNASLVEIARNSRGKYVIVLDNGQIWRQLTADTNRLRIPKQNSNLSVSVKRRALGAHTFSFDGDKRSIRVERIK